MDYKNQQNRFKYLLNKNNNFNIYKEIPSLKIINSTTKKKPYITIAIPTFRRPALLKEAISSALTQKNVKCEYDIIIVDNDYTSDGFSENEQVIKSFQTNKITYYQNKENLGMIGNWNRCFELAEGEWVALLHDDDLLMPNYINSISSLLLRKEDIGAICSNYILLGSHSSKKPIGFKRILQKLKNISLKIIPINVLSNRLRQINSKFSEFWNRNFYGPPTCGALFSKNKVLLIGGFNEELFPSADWFFWYSFNKEYKVYRPLVPLSYYRISVNESLNIQTIKGFIEDAGSFRKYSKENTSWGKIGFILFKYEQHYHYLRSHFESLQKNGYINTDFDYIEIFRERKIYDFLYKSSLVLFQDLSFLIALIIG